MGVLNLGATSNMSLFLSTTQLIIVFIGNQVVRTRNTIIVVVVIIFVVNVIIIVIIFVVYVISNIII